MQATLPVLCMFGLTLMTSASNADDLLISDVNVVDVLEGRVIANQDVLIRGDTINRIRRHEESTAEGVTIVSGTGKFLVPGYWDMHVHFRTRKFVDEPTAPLLIDENEALLDVCLAHGVTSVFDMGSDIPDELLAWRAAIGNGERTGPNLYLTGQKLEGPKPEFAASQEIFDKADADRALELALSSGFDGVKVMALWIDPDVLRYLLSKTRELGLKSFVHALETLRATDLSDDGFDAIAHLDNLLPEAGAQFESLAARVNESKSTTEAPGDFYWDLIDDFYEDIDSSVLRTSLDKMAANRTAVVSTYNSSRLRVFPERISTEILTPLDGVGSVFAENVRNRYEPRIGREPLPWEQRVYEANKLLLGLLPDSDVLFLIGTDSGFGNHAPGMSFHNEMASLQEAGLSPGYILRAATYNAALFMGRQDREGTVTAGMRADLLLLDDNPLDDIRHSKTIRAVLRDGHLIER